VSLYTPQILALAADLARYPLKEDLGLRASARSRTCGSVIDIGLDCDAEGRIRRVGMRVAACAIGQSSAAIMAQGLEGRSAAEVAAMETALAAWLAGEGTLPEWPQLDLLGPALPHKGRHGALLLPWTAASEALFSTRAKG
jgi:NifU-like protein involved in Fe-S cluster formation